VTTYKELAKVSGLHPRVVGILMKNNKNTLSIPCYKVVRSDGKVGGYSGKGGVKRKIELLKKDGIEVKNGKIDLKRYIYMFPNLKKSKFYKINHEIRSESREKGCYTFCYKRSYEKA
ncbi:MAG: MGMT family protein, partial [Candidatus Aenigmatarchaeota archaeon]